MHVHLNLKLKPALNLYAIVLFYLLLYNMQKLLL